MSGALVPSGTCCCYALQGLVSVQLGVPDLAALLSALDSRLPSEGQNVFRECNGHSSRRHVEVLPSVGKQQDFLEDGGDLLMQHIASRFGRNDGCREGLGPRRIVSLDFLGQMPELGIASLIIR